MKYIYEIYSNVLKKSYGHYEDETTAQNELYRIYIKHCSSVMNVLEINYIHELGKKNNLIHYHRYELYSQNYNLIMEGIEPILIRVNKIKKLLKNQWDDMDIDIIIKRIEIK